MTREEMLEWARKLHMGTPDDDFADRMYYLVALAIKQEREACLTDIKLERDSWTRGRNDMGVMVCDYITQAIIKRGMA